MPPEKPGPGEIEWLASAPQPGLVAEFYEFLKDNGKWWLGPILIILGVVGILAVLASSGLAPFLYTLF